MCRTAASGAASRCRLLRPASDSAAAASHPSLARRLRGTEPAQGRRTKLTWRAVAWPLAGGHGVPAQGQQPARESRQLMRGPAGRCGGGGGGTRQPALFIIITASLRLGGGLGRVTSIVYNTVCIIAWFHAHNATRIEGLLLVCCPPGCCSLLLLPAAGSITDEAAARGRSCSGENEKRRRRLRQERGGGRPAAGRLHVSMRKRWLVPRRLLAPLTEGAPAGAGHWVTAINGEVLGCSSERPAPSGRLMMMIVAQVY